MSLLPKSGSGQDITSDSFWDRNIKASKMIIDTIIEQKLDLEKFEYLLPSILNQKFKVSHRATEKDDNMLSLIYDVIDWENGKIHGTLQKHIYRNYVIIQLLN